MDESKPLPRGSQAAPYKTLSYGMNRGGAPVVVLLAGNHSGAGNAVGPCGICFFCCPNSLCLNPHILPIMPTLCPIMLTNAD